MNYKDINRKLWNARTKVHVHSKFYDVPGFIKGNNPLNAIELDLLGDISGKKILHLQCHFGMDTLQLARMGAHVTGVDLSDEAIREAKNLAKESGLEANFICCDVLELEHHLQDEFDIVFTSYGTIGWLPYLDRWASVIHHFLKPGGTFVFAEFHPVVWMFDEDFTFIQYSYFNKGMIEEEMEGTYTDGEMEKLHSLTWNHSISDVLTALLDEQLHLQTFREFDYSPYDCFKGTCQLGDRAYGIDKLEGKIPMVYALKAEKPA